jgi:hypothetical protein
MHLYSSTHEEWSWEQKNRVKEQVIKRAVSEMMSCIRLCHNICIHVLIQHVQPEQHTHIVIHIPSHYWHVRKMSRPSSVTREWCGEKCSKYLQTASLFLILKWNSECVVTFTVMNISKLSVLSKAVTLLTSFQKSHGLNSGKALTALTGWGVVLLTPFRQKLGQWLKLYHDCFHPHLFQSLLTTI